MKHSTKMIGMAAFLGLCLSGCMSAEGEASADRDRCASQGLAPATQAFDDCLAGAQADRRDTYSRRAARMQDAQNLQMDNFMHSSS